MTDAANQSQTQVVELSTVFFFKDRLPEKIALHQCGLPLKEPIPNTLSAYYGYQARAEGFVAAREYAQANGLQFTAVDFTVDLQSRNRGSSSPQLRAGDIAERDFLAFNKIHSGLQKELMELARDWLNARGIDADRLDFRRPVNIIAEYPGLVNELMQQPGWEQLRVFAHPAKLAYGDRIYSVATVPYRHWSHVSEAFCRFDPIEVTLEAPAPAPRPQDGNDRPVPAHAPSKPRRNGL